MKKLLCAIIFSVFLCSCSTNIYLCESNQDIEFILDQDETITIKSGQVFIAKKENYNGWRVRYYNNNRLIFNSPIFSKKNLKNNEIKHLKFVENQGYIIDKRYNNGYTARSLFRQDARNTIGHYSSKNYDSYTGSGSKTVHVKGYTRKDGTYVRPHTRSSPSRSYGSRRR